MSEHGHKIPIIWTRISSVWSRFATHSMNNHKNKTISELTPGHHHTMCFLVCMLHDWSQSLTAHMSDSAHFCLPLSMQSPHDSTFSANSPKSVFGVDNCGLTIMSGAESQQGGLTPTLKNCTSFLYLYQASLFLFLSSCSFSFSVSVSFRVPPLTHCDTTTDPQNLTGASTNEQKHMCARSNTCKHTRAHTHAHSHTSITPS